ncbi:sulfite exporter TauE/SafE family protein [Corynebacterium sp. 153RC1]|uniref:sulfite exporter TauE/SafE family protein n=1 Tax=unclassified Corynebacterium TaxID=2624378 RepID=UPI00211C7EBF|nr:MULTISPECIES: sulfite exporter TauE/SafE family protein [unclassified Corynebacterium]MCQ9370576.1 sulfite exporter TauE/SafE family protein [Corynebacterium sp. 35RC1]MCQ9352908.1 sulfite exporter TauE/SafE family protein [Corynebacterium sp. 209RC1]MCQ9353872.1 sulfite exporter TauE/SafE family protein [Corynebacterium sp. 1222RC1]MCQ9356903.1 sulfite exporter TauE/SafE family protein [Corynebacterium sp. 122RC1]MCQ9358246.1 sulfite exporter TauE/SafE family protein [Corynebacterium sp. 1
MLEILVVFCAVAVGSCMQRVSGMGLGLLAAPVLAMLLGPVEGVMVVNLLATINALLTTFTVKHHVDWKAFGAIASVLWLGALPAVLLINHMPGAWLQLIVGALLLIALGGVVFGARHLPAIRGTIPMLAAGTVGGFMNTLAGVAGPAITVYAQASGWEQRSFAATLQPIFVVAGLVSFCAKLLGGSGGVANTSAWVWVAGIAAMMIGIALGGKLATKISRESARKAALACAFAGGATVTVRGLLGVF